METEAVPGPRRVFISHSSRDATDADALVAALEEAGAPCWIAPRNIPSGSRYGEAIIDGINDCPLFVLLLSKHSNASPQVLAEVERAVSKGRSPVTIRLESVPLTKSLEYFLSAFHWLDAFPAPLESHLARLTDAVLQSAGAQSSFAPETAAIPAREAPNNLPPQLTSFIGREREVADIRALLANSRLLTLTGIGGTGKTRLSLRVAAEGVTEDAFCDGIWFVELAPLSDPALVPQTVANLLGVREDAGQPLVKVLGERCAAKRLLLILDNCEHVLAACAALATELLRSCPDVRILASSREPLGVPGEQIYQVPALSLPDLNGALTADSLAPYEAVRLFSERVQAVRPGFAVTDENADAVAQICRRLDGIPLALELAAARVRALSVDDVNTRLDNRFRLLTGGSKTLLPRQQTLRALIDWSYDLLTEQEKALLMRLSVFLGGWTLAAAEGVCAGDGLEDGEIVDLLTALADKSLVAYADAGGAGRYRLLETVRQYAKERLEETGDAACARAKQGAFFVALAEQAEPRLAGPEQAQWLSRLEVEHDNLREALAWSEEEAASNGGETWLRLCVALLLFWDVRGHFTEGRQWLHRALQRTETAPPSTLRVRALHAAGFLAWYQGDSAAAQALLERSLADARRLGSESGIADALNGLGLLAHHRGEYDAARALFSESLVLKRETGELRGIANALSNLGNVAFGLGDTTAAQTAYEESLSLRRRIGDQAGIARSLGNLGIIANQADPCAGRPLFEESLDLFRQIGDQRNIANTLNCLGNFACDARDPCAARPLFEESLNLYRQVGDKIGLMYTLEGLARVALLEGDAARAGCLWGATRALRAEIESPLTSQEIARQEKSREQARDLIGDVPFAAAFDAGRAWTLEHAVEDALRTP